jgi:hypothetical protein
MARKDQLSTGVGASVKRVAFLPAVRCRPWDREDMELAARRERVTIAEFIRAAVAERASRILNGV